MPPPECHCARDRLLASVCARTGLIGILHFGKIEETTDQTNLCQFFASQGFTHNVKGRKDYRDVDDDKGDYY